MAMLDLPAGYAQPTGQRERSFYDLPFRALRVLIQCAGEIATREETTRKLRPNGTIVDFDHSIN